MRTLVVSQQGARLRLRGEELIVEQGAVKLATVRLGEILQLVMMGSIELTPAARAALLRRGIDTVFMTVGGRYLGRLIGASHGNAPLRISQYESLTVPSTAIRLARQIVKGKVTNQRRLLMRVQNRRPHPDRAAAIIRLAWCERELDSASEIDVIRGLEGDAASVYFGAFGGLMTHERFLFEGRNRRPPRDPVNAMLSFGYALLQASVEGAVYRAGLDPYLGALHAPRQGATALVFDLMEEFRPLAVDSLVLRLINQRQVDPGDFRRFQVGTAPEEILAADNDGVSSDTGGSSPESAPVVGVHLADAGRKILIGAYYRALRRRTHHVGRGMRLTLSRIIVEQAYALARWIQGQVDDYRPHCPR
ncbi:MAG: CRISPR-associated endonuclease Cas1 [Acidobacteriota bacterium]|nr:CRISPR-associated endonuclease Cas1 [Acidobacteriota bacterium]MDQ7086531.1 CRISPR-associated endonuclease Cas1 [Acidobacteriota bacterium]